MIYEVAATFRGKRIRTTINFKRKAEAQKYADETNKYYPEANAKVVLKTNKTDASARHTRSKPSQKTSRRR